MTKLDWNKAKKKNTHNDVNTNNTGSFKEVIEFLCWDDGSPIEPELKNRLQTLDSLLKHINSMKFAAKPHEKRLESIWLARKLNKQLNTGLGYYGSTIYRKAIMILDSYQHWPAAPPTQAEMKRAKHDDQLAMSSLAAFVTTLSEPEFVKYSIKTQRGVIQNMTNIHRSLNSKKVSQYLGSSLEGNVISLLNAFSMKWTKNCDSTNQ